MVEVLKFKLQPGETPKGKPPRRVVRPASVEDRKKLEKIRLSDGRGVLQGLINDANTLNDPELRDAALGRVLKKRIQYVINTPVLVRELPYQQNDLLGFTEMIADPVRREKMKARIRAMKPAV